MGSRSPSLSKYDLTMKTSDLDLNTLNIIADALKFTAFKLRRRYTEIIAYPAVNIMSKAVNITIEESENLYLKIDSSTSRQEDWELDNKDLDLILYCLAFVVEEVFDDVGNMEYTRIQEANQKLREKFDQIRQVINFHLVKLELDS